MKCNHKIHTHIYRHFNMVTGSEEGCHLRLLQLPNRRDEQMARLLTLQG